MVHKVANDILIPEMVRLLEEGRQVIFTPTGVSMRPFIEGGRDSVLLTRASKLRVGDIVLANYRETYVLHRVYRIEKEEVVLMGDGNLAGEEHVASSCILAKVVAIRSPRGRRKPITRAFLWRWLLPVRRFLLKIYRKIFLPIFYS